MPTKTVDSRGRIYLPKDAREDFGDEFRVVKLRNGIKLIPVDDDPVEGLRKAMNGAEDIDIGEVDARAEEKMREEIEEDF